MRNLKKVLSLALALVMLLGMMMVGAGATDTGFKDDGTIKDSFKTAAAINKALGIMTGDGTNLNPTANITRAEAFILSLRVDGSNANEIASKWPVSEKPFNDVSTGKWYAPYLAYGKEMGLIAGSNGNYRPDEDITVVDYSVLLLGKLGFGEYTGANYTKAAKDAQDAGLYGGLGNINYYSHKLTREEACQMVFNAINYTDKAQETGNYIIRVTTDSKPASGLDGMVCSSRSEAAMMVTLYNMSLTDGDGKVVAKYEAEKDNSGSLAADVFKLTSTDSGKDDYGNPCTVWSVKNKPILTVPADAAVTYEGAVKADKIYKDLGLTKSTVGNIKVTTLVDGKSASATDLSGDAAVAGPGAVTRVYRSGNDVTITVVNTYVSTVTKVTAAKGEDARYITLADKAGTFETEDFAKDDVVLYTKGKDGIVSVELAEEVSGKLEKITNGKKWTVDGTDYVQSAQGDASKLASQIGKTVTFYVDTQGNIMKVKSTAVAETKFIYVLAGSEPKENDDYVVGTGKVAEVYAVLADGTVDRLTVSKLMGKSEMEEVKAAVTAGLYTYDTDSNGYLELTAVADNAPGSNISVNDTAVTVNGQKLALNSSTVFVFIETTSAANKTVKNVTVKTGVANIGDQITKYTEASGSTPASGDLAAVGSEDGAAKVVFVERAFNSVTDTNAVVYVTKVTTIELAGGKKEYSVDVLTAEGEEKTYTSTTAAEAGQIWTVTEEGTLGTQMKDVKSAVITTKVGNRVTVGEKQLFVTDDTSIVDTTGEGISELAVGQTVKVIPAAESGSKANNIAIAFVELEAKEPNEPQKDDFKTNTDDKDNEAGSAKNPYVYAGAKPGETVVLPEGVGGYVQIGDGGIQDMAKTGAYACTYEAAKGKHYYFELKDSSGAIKVTGAHSAKDAEDGKTMFFAFDTANQLAGQEAGTTETYTWAVYEGSKAAELNDAKDDYKPIEDGVIIVSGFVTVVKPAKG